MENNQKLYVAYGSNLHTGQMAYRCPDAKIYDTGVLKNYELTFWGNYRRFGVATVVKRRDQTVPVAVWSISEEDEKNLDVYEGWPMLYRKEKIRVYMDDGSIVTGMIYIMNGGGGMREAEPSDSYYETIETGYKTFGFDTQILKDAREKILRRFGFRSQNW